MWLMLAGQVAFLSDVIAAAAATESAAVAATLQPLPTISSLRVGPLADVPFDLAQLKQGWRQRIEAFRVSGKLPVIDIESSFAAGRFDPARYSRDMDDSGVAITVFSAETQNNWSQFTRRLIAADPSRYIPGGQAGVPPAWTEAPQAMLDDAEARLAEGYPVLGEFEFRHYPSPRQLQRGQTSRDLVIPIDGPLGHRLFQIAQATGRPFQLHYEIEDGLLGPLEAMLRQYPGARVIWCHLAQLRYQNRNTRYGPDYVRRLIEAHPNLYFDTAFGGPDSVYGGSGELHSRIWDRQRPGGGILPAWAQLIRDHPWRFLSALDIGGDRMERLPEWMRTQRRFLDALPAEVREIVAYKAAWKLLFGEDY